ncbi:MAG: lipid A-modifier LpxR family protein [Alphaproteobacteria bacterium]
MRGLASLAIVIGASGVSLGTALAEAPSQSHALSPDLRYAVVTAPKANRESASQDDVIGQLLELANLPTPQITWREDYRLRTVAASGETVDTLRISYGQFRSQAGANDLIGLYPANPDYEVLLSRDWPAALSLRGGRYAVDLTPHAGFAVSNRGNSAEAGATLTFGQNSDSLANALDHLGVHDGSALDAAGRWYVFAAASGRAMGLNMQKDEALGWGRSWSTDNASALVGDAQLGLGWRKGDMQTSLGLIHREVKGDHALWGQEFKTDSMVALSFSIKPKR